jgi:hypothetical protein
LFKGNNQTHGLINGKRPRFQKLDDGLEIRPLCVSGAEDIEFFLNE